MSRSCPRPLTGGAARWLFTSLVCGAQMPGCGPKAAPGTTDAMTGSTSSGTSTSDPVTSGSSSNEPLSTSGTSSSMSSEPAPTTSDPGNTFIIRTDVLTCVVGHGARCSLCDVFLQDCKDGEKCEAVIIDGGGAWNSTRCVPVTGDGVAGDPCTAESVDDGLDSCAKGNMCWGVDMDGNGTCVALCKGSADAPTCPNDGDCTISNDGVLNLCLGSCDPLLQDCAEGDACYPVDDGFTCAPDASGDTGMANDPCGFINSCDAGLLCGDPAFVGAGCSEGPQGCCTPFCEFPDGACPNPDQQCVQLFDPMMLPPDDPLLVIGACGIPA